MCVCLTLVFVFVLFARLFHHLVRVGFVATLSVLVVCLISDTFQITYHQPKYDPLFHRVDSPVWLPHLTVTPAAALATDVTDQNKSNLVPFIETEKKRDEIVCNMYDYYWNSRANTHTHTQEGEQHTREAKTKSKTIQRERECVWNQNFCVK